MRYLFFEIKHKDDFIFILILYVWLNLIYHIYFYTILFIYTNI